MKPILFAAIIGSALVAGGIFVIGDSGVARVASPQSAVTSVPVRQAAGRTVTLRVENMFCASCPYIVKQSLVAVPGVKDVSVSFRDNTATVTFDSAQTSVAALTDATSRIRYLSEIKSP